MALCVVYWGLKIFAAPLPLPAQTQLVSLAPAPRGDLARLLGPDPVPAEVEASDEPVPVNDDRFALLGVVSPRSAAAAREGVALIAVDGQPARAFRVGARVDGDTVLQTVAHNRITLGPRNGAATVALELAPPAPATQGTLPAAVNNFNNPRPQAFGGRAPTAMPPAKFVTPNMAPPPTPQPYAPSQVMAQPMFNQAPDIEMHQQDADAQETTNDPNPLR